MEDKNSIFEESEIIVDMNERRKLFREKVIEAIYFSNFNEDGSLNIQGQGSTVDFSPMGMQICIDNDLPINTRIMIDILMPDEIHRFTGEVVWVNQTDERCFAAGIRILYKKIIYRNQT